MAAWYFDPHSGGTKIPVNHYQQIIDQVNLHEQKQKWFPKFKIQLRFKGQFCYLDGYKEGEVPFPVGRVRYFDDNSWSLAFYTYSNERYKPCLFRNGKWLGIIEDAIDICSTYFQ